MEGFLKRTLEFFQGLNFELYCFVPRQYDFLRNLETRQRIHNPEPGLFEQNSADHLSDKSQRLVNVFRR